MEKKFEFLVIVTVGFIAAIVLFLIYDDDKHQTSSFSYEQIEYDDLVSRNAKLGLYAVPENYDQKVCFSISNENEVSGLDFISAHLEETSRVREDIKFSDIPPKFYTFFDTPINPNLALEMITTHDFHATKIHTNNNIAKIPDNAYYFDCPFEYENENMMLRIMFESHFWGE